jgi:phosphatidylserine/phosphatidylglycerophosphate/cardiolipin synthase-like enzyme
MSASGRAGTPADHREEIITAPGERRDAVVRVIRSARQRLVLSLFRCSDYLVLDELAEAARRGVRVEALLTPRVKQAEKKRLRELGAVLESMGVKVFRYSDPIVKYHAKYMVADDGPALVASLNFTSKCFTNTCDFQLLTYDGAVVSSLKRLFESDCVSREGPLPERLSDRLIVGPDRSRSRISGLLEQARRSIRIIDHKLADPTIVALLKGQKEKGVLVEVLGEVPGLRPHGKMILVDDATAVIGSIALASLHLDFRREVAIVIEDPRCIAHLSSFFRAAAARVPAPPAPGAAA